MSGHAESLRRYLEGWQRTCPVCNAPPETQCSGGVMHSERFGA